MKMINQTVARNLKRIRELSGYTQEAVAKAIGTERSTYSNYEGGTREVPYEVIEKTADLFGCEPFILFEDDIYSENEMLVTSFRISGLSENDLKEVAGFKDIVKSYLKMERISKK